MSIKTRFIIVVIGLLTFLVGSILFIVGKREEQASFEEQKDKGVIIANYIALENIEPLVFWDNEGVEDNIEKLIDNNLIYVALFDRNSELFASTQFVKENKSINKSNFANTRDSVEKNFFKVKKLTDRKSGRTFNILEIETPIFTEGSQRRWGSVKIGISLEGMFKEIRNTRLMLIFIGCIGILIGIVGAVILANRITNPLNRLVEATIKVSKGDFSQEIDISSQDEVGNLAQSFNEMSRRLQIARQKMEAANRKLIQAEKLASIGRISAGIAHEIRNPLTSVKLNIQKIIQSEQLGEIEKEHLNIAQQGISQIEKFVKELLNFTRVSVLNKDLFSTKEIVEEAIKTIIHSFELKNIHLIKELQENLPSVKVDGDKIKQVIINILRNAIEAVNNNGKIGIILSKDLEKKGIRIKIFDDGPGIPEKEKELIFEPFYTSKSSGIGMGLANAKKVINQHMGSIEVKDFNDKGTLFEIFIPYEEER